MEKLIRRHHISFKNAFSGLKWAVSTQPNFRVHFLLSILAVIAAIYLRLSALEWILLIFTIFWGLATEMLNTAIEAICDLITQEWRKEIKIAKDVAAAMMLTVAAGSVIVALLLFIPKLISRL